MAQVDSDHWSVGIRGFGAVLASKLLVLIDGRSVYTPLFAGVYWQAQATPLEDIERIEVIRGPGGTIWGANAVDGIINIITKSTKDTHGSMVSLGGGNVDQGTAASVMGPGTARVSTIVSTAWASTGVLSFIRTAGTSMTGEWARPDSAQTGIGVLAIPSRFRATSTARVPGKRPTYALYSPPSQVTVYGNAELSGGNLLGRWKRVLNDRSDFQIQAYFDRTNHFEPEFGETRDTFDVDFLDHLTLPGQQNFLWGLGARVSPANVVQTRPDHRLSAAPTDGPRLQRLCAGRDFLLQSPARADRGFETRTQQLHRLRGAAERASAVEPHSAAILLGLRYAERSELRLVSTRTFSSRTFSRPATPLPVYCTRQRQPPVPVPKN